MATPTPPCERPLDYADPLRAKKPRSPNFLLYVALACGLLPMGAGTIAIVGWFTTGWGIFRFVGLFTILGGCLLFLAGIATLFTYVRREWMTAPRLDAKPLAAAALAAAILLGNFPLCGLYLRLGQLSRIHFDNLGTTPVTNIALRYQGGRTTRYGPLPAGRLSRHWIEVRGADWMTVTATVNGAPISQDFYTSTDTGGTKDQVTFNANGSVTLAVR